MKKYVIYLDLNNEPTVLNIITTSLWEHLLVWEELRNQISNENVRFKLSITGPFMKKINPYFDVSKDNLINTCLGKYMGSRSYFSVLIVIDRTELLNTNIALGNVFNSLSKDFVIFLDHSRFTLENLKSGYTICKNLIIVNNNILPKNIYEERRSN